MFTSIAELALHLDQLLLLPRNMAATREWVGACLADPVEAHPDVFRCPDDPTNGWNLEAPDSGCDDRLTPGQIAVVLAALHDNHGTGFEKVVVETAVPSLDDLSPAAWAMLRWTGVVQLVGQFGCYAIPWLTRLIRRFEQNLPDQLPAMQRTLSRSVSSVSVADHAADPADAIDRPVGEPNATPLHLPEAGREVTPNSIRRRGANWEVLYGVEKGSFAVNDHAALAVVAKLVARPHHAFQLFELVAVDPRALLEHAGSQGDVLDGTAIVALRQRYADLQQDHSPEADPLMQLENEEEAAKILEELKKVTGPGNLRRTLGRNQAGKAWDTLRKGLRRLWQRLKDAQMVELATHLEKSVLLSRPTVTYHPPADTSPWDAEGESLEKQPRTPVVRPADMECPAVGMRTEADSVPPRAGGTRIPRA